MSDKIQIENPVQQAQITRSDIADVKRAIQDLKKQVGHVNQNMMQQLVSAKQITPDVTNQIVSKRNELNQLNEKIENLEQTLLNNHLPTQSTARLNQTEQKEICGFYATGRYTQKDLAEQYGVSQPAISDVIKKNAGND